IVGEGGMGRVYLAHHKIIGKPIAVKILHPELARDKEAVGRFVREAKAASSIGNPHIVDISDFGELDDGSTYFVMEYLDGEPLADLMERHGRLDHNLVYDIVLQLCDGLAAAHAQQIVHRDLKPENITLIKQGDRENFCKILDFGIAKVSTNTSKLTKAGSVFGTPHYMAPEQAAGAAVDHRADIYALGVMMYEMVAGELPFNADNFMGILTQHMYKAPVPIRALLHAPECPPGLEAIILKCLSKQADARYQTAPDLAADIQRHQAGEIPAAVNEMMARSGSFNVPADYFKRPAHAVVPGSPHGPRRRRGPKIALVAGVTVAIALVAAILIRGNVSEATAPEPTAEVEKNAGASPANTSGAGTAAVPAVAIPTKEVMVQCDRDGASARIAGRDYELPQEFDVPEGKTLTAVISLKGYTSKTLHLDGKQARIEVTLQPKPRIKSRTAPARARKPKRRAAPRRPKNSGDVVDPW
ncbi:MAG: serine/threonine-protein kinase, partial [Polyangiaceae bacterium]